MCSAQPKPHAGGTTSSRPVASSAGRAVERQIDQSESRLASVIDDLKREDARMRDLVAAKDLVEFSVVEPTHFCAAQSTLSALDRIFTSLPGWVLTQLDGVVTDEVLPAVAVVAGGATTVPLLRLTAPKALLTEANGGAIEDGDTALETVDDDGVGPPTNAAWPLVKGDDDPLTRDVAPAKEKLHISRGSKIFFVSQ